jgi:type IV secretion system protein VirB10
MTDNNKDDIGAIPSIDNEREDVNLQGVKGKRQSNGLMSSILIFGVVVLLIVGVAGWFIYGALHKNSGHDDGKPVDPTLTKNVVDDTGNKGVDKLMTTIAERKREQEAADEKARKDEEARRAAEEAKQKQLMAELEARGRLNDGNKATGQQQQQQAGTQDQPMTPEMRKLQGKGLVFTGSDGKGAKEETEGFGGGLTDALRGGTYADGRASVLRNRSYLLGMGTVLPCVLKTKIVTTYQGLPICQLTKNIYSNDGNTLLLEAGTDFFGEIQKALVQGQARVFVNWTTAQTPKGVRVRIDALGVDGLGAAGIPAWVDLHFWERFGNAIMLSFINDAIATAASHASNNNNNNNGVKIDNTEDAAKNMANTALENSINIPPTGYINQGELISIIVPRDTYFNNVYEIH